MFCLSISLFAGCVAEMTDVVLCGNETLNVSFEPETKIHLDAGQQLVWDKDDLLSVYNYRDVNERWIFKGESGETSGVIARNEVIDGGSSIGNIIVVYPYREDYILNEAQKSISTNFAPTQTYYEGSFGLNDNVMVSSGAGNEVILKNVFGWLKFQMTGSVSISKIMLYSNDYCQLNGAIDVNYETLSVDFIDLETVKEDYIGGTLMDNVTLTLNCGEKGVVLDHSKSTPFYLAVVPQTFKNGFTVEITGTDGRVMKKIVSREIVVERNVIKPFAVFQFDGQQPEDNDENIDYTDLSAEETANSYIVSEAGYYKFKTVNGNSDTSVEEVAEAAVLWETFGTDVRPDSGDLVSNVKYSDGYIYFKASDKKGNASIAAKDASGTILWSWHIWMTDQPKDQVYRNNAGIMMDRNLGATSAIPGDVEALGLMYQWGRKDPFLGNSSIYCDSYFSDTHAKSANSIGWGVLTVSDGSNGTIAYSIANPLIYIVPNSNNNDWYYSEDKTTDDTRWQSNKTVYDPCPSGYRVPDGGLFGVWSTALGISDSFTLNTFDSTNKGFNFCMSNANECLTEEAVCWYPAAGWSEHIFSYSYTGRSGLYWSCTPDGNKAYIFGYNSFYSLVFPSGNNDRGTALPVRCLKENTFSPPIPIEGTVEVTVETPGGLENALSGYDCTAISSLKIKGVLNEEDFIFFRDMQSLKRLDISEVNISKILDKAFYETLIEEVVLPKTLTVIGEGLFYNSKLRSIEISVSVESIEADAFNNCILLKSVSFDVDSSLKSIGEGAFAKCESLKTIKMPASVETIGPAAFNSCTSLESVTFEANSNLKLIQGCYDNSRSGAFSYCKSLKSIEIPASVDTIGAAAFYECSSLDSVIFEEKSELIVIKADAFSRCGMLKSIEIPSSVETIETDAFSWCSSLESVSFGQNSKLNAISTGYYDSSFTTYHVGSGSFSYCKSLKSIEIPASVVIIDASAFRECSSLESVTFEANSKLETIRGYGIDHGAFTNCKSLKSIVIPASVRFIGSAVFRGCESLESVTFEANSNLRSIYSEWDSQSKVYGGAFSDCISLKSIVIPSSVENIGSATFKGCTLLESVTFEANSILESIQGGDYYDYDCNGTFADCKSLTSLEIPASVEKIGSSAFYGCEALKSIIFETDSKLKTIGNKAFRNLLKLSKVDMEGCEMLESIGEYAFYGCTKLSLVKVGTAIPPICGNEAFLKINSYSVLKVPNGSIDAYKEANEWKRFLSFSTFDE